MRRGQMCITLPSSLHFFLLRLAQVTEQVDELWLVLCKSNTFDDSELLLNNEQFHLLLLLPIITMQVLVFLLKCFESHQKKKKP